MEMPKWHSVNEVAIYVREFSIPPDDISMVHDFLSDIWEENPRISGGDRNSIETAVIELTSNIILYSNATGGIRCQITIEVDREEVHITVTDNGDLADLEIDEHIMPDEFSESGRGIPLIRALVDEFTFENLNRENTWKISKRIQL